MATLQCKMQISKCKFQILWKLFFQFTFFILQFAIFNDAFAAQEILKTSRVSVGEKVVLTETLKKANEEGKIIVLVLLPGPMGCRRCDSLISLLEKETSRYKDDAVFIMAGGQDMLGAMDKETFELKRSYGFVTMGEAWTFIIDKNGILKKIFMGAFTKEEIGEVLNGSR